MLIQLYLNEKNLKGIMDAKLSLRSSDSGMLELRFHPVRKEPNFTEPLFGHHFTEEDKIKLLETGNMGRVVNLIHPITKESYPSLISRDRLTNDLIPLFQQSVRIPLVIKGVTLNLEQRQILKEGKPLHLENMISKRGTLFDATVQFNTDRQFGEFLFPRNIKNLQFNQRHHHHNNNNNNNNNSQKVIVPNTFRGKTLKSWQWEKLNKGEVAYIDGLTDKNNRKNQGYISFDKNYGKFEFSYNNPNKQRTIPHKAIIKSKGRRM